MTEKMKCGHPRDWAVIRLSHAGKRYSYCIGCMIEKMGLEPVEGNINPLISYKHKKEQIVEQVIVPQIKEIKVKKTKEV